MTSGRISGWLVAAASVLVLAIALPGRGAPKRTVDSTIGFVDLGVVTEQVKKTAAWQQAVKQWEDEQARAKNEVDDLSKIRYLTPGERSELTTLRAKAKANDREKERIRELEEKSDKLDAEFQGLAQLEKPTPDQVKRMNELKAMRESALGTLSNEGQTRKDQLDKTEGELLSKLQAQIVKAVEQVATSQGLSVVVDRNAILYGGTDVTDEVVKKLPK